jgi:hypothetical protein
MYQATSSGGQNVALLNGNRQLGAGMQPWGVLGAGMQPWGALGATTTGDVATLMAGAGVREYKKGTMTVWASYQCPPCNAAIMDMQAQLSRASRGLGKGGILTADGVVGDATLAVAKAVGAAALGRYEYVAEGAGISGAAGSKERLARNALAVAGWARAIADRLAVPTVTITPSSSPVPSLPTGPTAPAPAAPQLPPDMVLQPASSGFMTFLKAKWPWLVGGGILVAGGLVAASIVTAPAPRHARGAR